MTNRIREQWFAVQIRPRFEKTAFQLLHEKGYNLLLPLCRTRRQWKYRSAVLSVPLFPGYLFCRMNPDDRLPVLTTPGVVRIVSSGRTLAPLEEREVESIRTLMASGMVPQPWPFVRPGDEIEIPWGPLRGVHGTVLEQRDGHKLVVSVTLLQRSVAVEIENDWLRGLHLHTVGPRARESASGRYWEPSGVGSQQSSAAAAKSA